MSAVEGYPSIAFSTSPTSPGKGFRAVVLRDGEPVGTVHCADANWRYVHWTGEMTIIMGVDPEGPDTDPDTGGPPPRVRKALQRLFDDGAIVG